MFINGQLFWFQDGCYLFFLWDSGIWFWSMFWWVKFVVHVVIRNFRTSGDLFCLASISLILVLSEFPHSRFDYCCVDFSFDTNICSLAAIRGNRQSMITEALFCCDGLELYKLTFFIENMAWVLQFIQLFVLMWMFHLWVEI